MISYQNGELINTFQLAITEWHCVILQSVFDMFESYIVQVVRIWNVKDIGLDQDIFTLDVYAVGLGRLNFLK